MNTNFTEEYKNWITKLSKVNFDELILNYLKEYYETKEAYISDGPYDGGVDLIFTKDNQTSKRNIQITVKKKGYEKKLEEDLEKSKKNVLEYGYLATLDFYISQAVTPVMKKKIIRNADVNYQIALKIIDANELAGLAQEYKVIRETIYKFNKCAFPDENINIDKNTKILFDTLSMSRDITALKNNFSQSLILTHLYQKSKATVSEIYEDLNEVFFRKYDKNFFETEIGKLKSDTKIIDIPNTNPKQFMLAEDTQILLEQIDQNSQIHEGELISALKGVLKRYDIEKETEEVAKYIIDLYNANYEIDEIELLNEANNHNKKIQQIFENLICHLQKNRNIDNQQSEKIAVQLLAVCKKNEFLNKTSISKMFTNLFKLEKLDSYLSTSKRKVYLDTQILLQTICYSYEDIVYEDQLYKAVKIFTNTLENSNVPILLHTTIGYVEEVAWHIFYALKLERFLELDFIQDLGPSKNVFFNYYLEIKNDIVGFP